MLSAAPIVRIDFPCQNFWGHMTCLDELPSGVWLGERQTFHDKKRKGYDFPVFVDLAKATEFELNFKFNGTREGHVRLMPELTGYADDGCTQMTELQVLAFEIDGDKSFRAPGVFKSWYGVTPFISATDKELLPNSPVWRIPETGEPGGLPSMGWHRVVRSFPVSRSSKLLTQTSFATLSTQQ